MVKFTCIVFILFSGSICFGQNSETHVKDLTSSTTSASKVGPGANPKVPLKKEVIGTQPKSPNPDPLQNTPYNPSPSDKNQDKKTAADKNTSKPY